MKSDNSCLQLTGYQVLNPFSDEVKFEKFIVDVFNSIDKTNTYSQFGRRGQKQHGFDVSSIETKTVIQCKLKIIDRDDNKIRQELLKELDDDFSDFEIFNSDNEFHFSKFFSRLGAVNKMSWRFRRIMASGERKFLTHLVILSKFAVVVVHDVRNCTPGKGNTTKFRV